MQDEPTAHLDIQAVESLVACLRSFAGAVLLVSHDQHVIRSLAKEVGELWCYSSSVGMHMRGAS